MDCKITAPERADVAVMLPPSKSIAARALVVNALCHEPGRLTGVAVCDDTHALMQGLAVTHGAIDVGLAGTAMRFLMAYHACQPGHDVTLDGTRRMRERPMLPLVEALRAMDAHIDSLGHDEKAPWHIQGRTLQGRHVTLRADVSSQFVSALMLIGPVIGGLVLELEGDIVSAPYIEMTQAVMRHYGIDTRWHDRLITVPAGEYRCEDLAVEADWSAAAWWLALQVLLPQSRITLHGLASESWQGDSRVLALMQQMGMTVHWHADGTLTMDMSRVACCCCSTYADLNGTPDLAPVLITALCLLGRPFRLTGLRTLRHKESDRREALRHELMKLGYVLQLEGDDAVAWHFEACQAQQSPCIDPHGDHRIAMALALAATRHPGITIRDAEVVEKSYPAFWRHLRQAGFTINDMKEENEIISTDAQQRRLSAIVVVADDGAIGRDGGLLCHLPADLKHFKQLTMGHSIVMGRRTFESFPKGALPGRQNIVVTRNPRFEAPGVTVAHDIDEAVAAATMPGDVFIIGGAQIYAATLHRVDTLHLTCLHAVFPDADAHFPMIDPEQWETVDEERHEADDRNPYAYTFVTLRRCQ